MADHDYCPYCSQFWLVKRADQKWREEMKSGRCGVCGKEDLQMALGLTGQGFTNEYTGEISPWMCADCAKTWTKERDG